MKPTITDLTTELTFKTSRSGGSGGQHVNKVSSKVELNFDVHHSAFLTEEQRDKICEKLASRINSEGILQVISKSERSQFRNKKIAIDKFIECIESCFVVVKKRRATQVPKGVKEKRLLEKKRKAEIKKWRSGLE
jgi:ribosome-associated protein